MFIFITDQELYAYELMYHIMSCDNSLGRKDILKFIYCFMTLSFTIYIFKHFLLLIPFSRNCNNVLILSLIIFYLNWNEHMNLYKYKIF
jgi:hypothetical protein